MTFAEAMDHISEGFEALAALVLALGLVWSAVLAARTWRQSGDGRHSYTVLRESFGSVVLLALEILVAADLLRTVAVAPSLDNVAALGLIVLIRTFLSFSLLTEIEGVAPWRRLTTSGATVAARAVARSKAGDPSRSEPATGDKPSGQ